MINRILIRIKVVQILYSFLLVEKKFTLEEMPENPTREKRYAYGLYMDMLALMLMISERVERRKGDFPLMQTRLINRLKEDDRLRALLVKSDDYGSRLRVLASRLAEEIKESAAYRTFLRDADRDDVAAEEAFWPVTFRNIVMQSNSVKEYAASLEGHTLKGVETMEGMMDRTFVNFMSSQDSLAEGQKTLEESLEKSRELYFRLLSLAVDLTYMQRRRLDENRYKFLRNDEDLNPNTKFIDNRAVEALSLNPVFGKYIEKNRISWIHEDPILMNALLKAVTESDVYAAYMADPERSMAADCELWKELYRKVILPNPHLIESLEEKSVFWNDDLDIIGTFVVKTFRRMEEGRMNPILDKYKDEEDAVFGSQLMKYVYGGKERYEEWIGRAVKGSEWEADRLAFMDVVIIMTALAEILNFPKIPLTVSINEYIEMAKAYCSAKSGTFVNGVLSAILRQLREEGILLKS